MVKNNENSSRLVFPLEILAQSNVWFAGEFADEIKLLDYGAHYVLGPHTEHNLIVYIQSGEKHHRYRMVKGDFSESGNGSGRVSLELGEIKRGCRYFKRWKPETEYNVQFPIKIYLGKQGIDDHLKHFSQVNGVYIIPLKSFYDRVKEIKALVQPINK